MWYNIRMKHWSVDTDVLKRHPREYARWRLENAINAGMREGKIREADLREHWDDIDIDPHKRAFLALLLS